MIELQLLLSIINQSLILYNGLPQDVKDKQAEAWQGFFDNIGKMNSQLGALVLPVFKKA